MKLIAQSQIPTTPLPYLHLGYTAAIGLNTALDGCLLTVAVWAIGLTVAKAHGHRSRLIVPAVVLVMLLSAGFGYYTFIEGGEINARVKTRSIYMLKIKETVQIAWIKGDGTYPHSIPELRRLLAQKGDYVNDGWHREMRFTATPRHGSIDFLVQSAGRDGTFGTADDIRLAWTCDPLPPKGTP